MAQQDTLHCSNCIFTAAHLTILTHAYSLNKYYVHELTVDMSISSVSANWCIELASLSSSSTHLTFSFVQNKSVHVGSVMIFMKI